jgi:hypothetical protein
MIAGKAQSDARLDLVGSAWRKRFPIREDLGPASQSSGGGLGGNACELQGRSQRKDDQNSSLETDTCIKMSGVRS